jgi:nucleoside-diphosphate-sugar epimerase
MAIFLTGSTGYIGAHVAANLLRDHGAALNVLVMMYARLKAVSGRPCNCIWIFRSFTNICKPACASSAAT